MSKPVMYLFANQGLGMSPGKLAAQTVHASTFAGRNSDQWLLEKWLEVGHPVIILAARDTEHLRNIETYLNEKGFLGYPIIDEGRTEVPPQSYTALGIPIVDKDREVVQFAFSDFKTYKELPPEPERRRWYQF